MMAMVKMMMKMMSMTTIEQCFCKSLTAFVFGNDFFSSFQCIYQLTLSVNLSVCLVQIFEDVFSPTPSL